MSEPSNMMTDEERVKLVKDKHRKIKFRDTMLSVTGIALFFLIWELLVITGIVDSKKLCDVLDIFILAQESASNIVLFGKPRKTDEGFKL